MYYNKKSYPPKRMLGLEAVSTNKIITVDNKVYLIKKLIRSKSYK